MRSRPSSQVSDLWGQQGQSELLPQRLLGHSGPLGAPGELKHRGSPRLRGTEPEAGTAMPKCFSQDVVCLPPGHDGALGGSARLRGGHFTRAVTRVYPLS